MNTIVAAIRVSINGGNHKASGTNPKAEAMSEIEWATVNEVTTMMSGRSRRAPGTPPASAGG